MLLPTIRADGGFHPQDPRWGRNEEVPSEDPMMNDAYAAAFTRGFQEGDVADHSTALRDGFGTSYWKASVTVKHCDARLLPPTHTTPPCV